MMTGSNENSILPVTTPVHMMGVCGAGMSGLAYVMAGMGYSVSGCDAKPTEVAERLRSLGVSVFEGHDPTHVTAGGLLVASAAIPDSNAEVAAARDQGVEVISRAEMLGRLMAGRYGIAISGTHGKTTTTSMIALVLERAGLDPTILIGGDLGVLGGNAKLGKSEYFVTEACEAYGSFLSLRPRMAVITNIEHDHHDCYPTLDDVMSAFRTFLSQVEAGGMVIACADCPNVRALIPEIAERVVSYGLSEDADVRAAGFDAESANPSFRVMHEGCEIGEFALGVPGRHNVLNALAAIAVGVELGVGPEVMREALAEFRGAERRFDVLGEASGITVVDDYAHHPTEVRATLDAARARGRRVIAVFQPHLYSRTRALAADFAESLSAADEVVLTEIYAAREQPMPGVSGEMIAEMVNSSSPRKARFIAEKGRVAAELVAELRSGDLVVFMGAGDIRESAEELLRLLSAGQ